MADRNDELITINEAVKEGYAARQTIYRHMVAGTLKLEKSEDGRVYLAHRSDLERLFGYKVHPVTCGTLQKSLLARVACLSREQKTELLHVLESDLLGDTDAE